MRHDIRDYLRVFREADELLAKSSTVYIPARNVLVAKYVAAARAESTWCGKEIIYEATKTFGLSARTIYTAMAEYAASSTAATTIAASTAIR